MRISNKGLLSAMWFVLSVSLLVYASVSVARDGICGNPTMECVPEHILETFSIPLAGLVGSLFLCTGRWWPRIVLGLAAAGVMTLVAISLLITCSPKPYVLDALLSAFSVWTLVTVIKRPHERRRNASSP